MRPPRVSSVITGAAFLALLSLKVWGIEQRAQLETTTGTLHGTLDLPNDPSPCPVVVIIAGSGPTDRDGNQASMRNDSLKLLGRALATNGIAALRYDKRGIAESAGSLAGRAFENEWGRRVEPLNLQFAGFRKFEICPGESLGQQNLDVCLFAVAGQGQLADQQIAGPLQHLLFAE